MTLRVAVTGTAGRMGRALVQALQQSESATLAQAVARPGHALVGEDASALIESEPLGVAIADALSGDGVDCLIEFTAPDATLEHARWASEHRVAVVVGTTALSAEQHRELQKLAGKTPILWAPNMSPGVGLMLQLVNLVAKNLKEYDAEVHETHHRHKLDAPSGTALRIGEAIAAARGMQLERVAEYEGVDGVQITAPAGGDGSDEQNKPADAGSGRNNAPDADTADGGGQNDDAGSERNDTPDIGSDEQNELAENGKIKFRVSRTGEVIGEHSALFSNDMEQLEIHHRAFDRLLFARSAIRAALWLAEQKPGALYGIQDIFTAK